MVSCGNLSHTKAKWWQDVGQSGLWVSSELIYFNFLDAQFRVDSFSWIDLVFEEGSVVVTFIKFHFLLQKFNFKFLSKSWNGLLILNGLLLLEEIVFQFFDLELGLSFDSLDLEFILPVVIVSLLLISFDSLVVFSSQFFCLIQLISLAYL